MKMPEIRGRAKELGLVGTQRMNKGELIRSIQRAEGNCDCYAAGRRDCRQDECCWRADCLATQARG